MIREANHCQSCQPIEDRCPPTEGDTVHATQNACNLCAPLGAALAFAGIRGCLSILHGSQGCATYIRRYLISHFREPMDIASSSFGEQDAIFGGGRNLMAAIDNVLHAYAPEVIGVATTCLAETIGEDVGQILRDYRSKQELESTTPIPPFLQVSTPSYAGDHWHGFHKTVRAILESALSQPASAAADQTSSPPLLLPGMLSCEDLRHLKQLCEAFELPTVLAPDYSDTLDGGSWSSYHRLPEGGTPLASITQALKSRSIITLGAISSANPEHAGSMLSKQLGSTLHAHGLPIGIRETDALLQTLTQLSGRPTPASLTAERARLVDSYVDGHKYLSGQRVIVFGDPDLLVGLCSLLQEMGLHIVAVATGSDVSGIAEALTRSSLQSTAPTKVVSKADHAAIATLCREHVPDLIIGNSKGYPISRELGIPLVRVGMPIHDRMGAQRILHVGYAGAQQLFDRIVNTLLEKRQDHSDIGFAYL